MSAYLWTKEKGEEEKGQKRKRKEGEWKRRKGSGERKNKPETSKAAYLQGVGGSKVERMEEE